MDWVCNWLKYRSDMTPDQVAVVDGRSGKRWTFAELNQRACRVAHYLQTVGVGRGDRIALLSVNHMAYFDFLFTCMKIGAIFVPLNWRLSVAELTRILREFVCYEE